MTQVERLKIPLARSLSKPTDKSDFICVHLRTLREGEAPTSVVPNP
jgi:hypothetical protein